jgi:hypothetical protein
MSRLPPEIEHFFNQQKREQRFFETTALVKKNVRQTTIAAIGVLDRLHQRGTQIEATEEMAATLETSSREFLKESTPWWRKGFLSCIPAWWCVF